MTEHELAHQVLCHGQKVHGELGPGHSANLYEERLYSELLNAGLKTERQKPVFSFHKTVKQKHLIDLVIEETLIIELKSVHSLNSAHLAQVLKYLQLADYKLGLLINFNVFHFENGVKRINNFPK